MDLNKCVVVAAPHTTNWDLPYMLMFALILRMRVYWLGKDTMFESPFGFIFRWLGGIPVNRKESTGIVEMCSNMIASSSKKIHLVVAPSGTRKNIPVKDWKLGFYRIANKAKVPILLAAINYKEKRLKMDILPFMVENERRDLCLITKFYQPFMG